MLNQYLIVHIALCTSLRNSTDVMSTCVCVAGAQPFMRGDSHRSSHSSSASSDHPPPPALPPRTGAGGANAARHSYTNMPDFDAGHVTSQQQAFAAHQPSSNGGAAGFDPG